MTNPSLRRNSGDRASADGCIRDDFVQLTYLSLCRTIGFTSKMPSELKSNQQLSDNSTTEMCRRHIAVEYLKDKQYIFEKTKQQNYSKFILELRWITFHIIKIDFSKEYMDTSSFLMFWVRYRPGLELSWVTHWMTKETFSTMNHRKFVSTFEG